MKTDLHKIACIDGLHEMSLDIFTMDGVEAADGYDQPHSQFQNGGFRIEARINGTPAGIYFYSHNLGSTYYGQDSADAARAILADARRNGLLPPVAH